METPSAGIRLRGRLIDSLHTEAMLLADEARSYFEQTVRIEREKLQPLMRVTLSCESLKITTRLMLVLSWLLTQRALETGQIARGDSLSRFEWREPSSDSESWAGLPAQAVALIEASHDLCARVQRLDNEDEAALSESPALGLLSRLEKAF